MTTTLLELDQKLLEAIGDFKRHPVTTALAASTSLVSTHLTNYRSSVDVFNDFWAYVEDENNAGADRNISDDDGTNTLTVRGGNFTSDGADLATFRLSRYQWAQRKRAIIRTIEEIYPALYRPLDIHTLITGNMLPNSHFEDWALTTIPDKYVLSGSGASAAEETTVTRGGASSLKLTRSGTNCYVYVGDAEYPRLLDLMGRTVNFKAWVHCSNANQARLTIYTNTVDGTSQTENSSYHTGGGNWELLEIEDFKLNDDLVDIEFRFGNNGNDSSTYYDAARVGGKGILEYLLPTDFANGGISEVHIQSRGYSDDICDDLQPRYWEKVYGWDIVDDGTDKHLRLPYLYGANRQIRLIGNTPLETLSDASDTISLDGEKLNLLIAYAKYCLYQMVPGVPASEDIGRFESAEAKALFEYNQLSHLKMHNQPRTLKLRIW